ncbi:MAG: hypothetical protein HY825_00510 [Acidobacteria bacterium]|nr:hypothetical protein [Acidobacteriota bacterium]
MPIKTPRSVIDEALWTMLADGLVSITMPIQQTSGWRWRITDRGRRCAGGDAPNPDDPGAYLARLKKGAAGFAGPVEFYTTEALRAYNGGCFAASTVMIGVAAEAGFQVTAEAFVYWLEEPERDKFERILGNARGTYATKFARFRELVDQRQKQLDASLRDGLDAVLHSVGDFLRISRNEAGHPTGKVVEREEAHTYLVMFAFYVRRLLALGEFFGSAVENGEGES